MIKQMESFKIPFFLKASIICLGLYALVSALYILQNILVPIIGSIIIAMLLNPLVQFFTRFKMNRILAISISLLLLILIGGGLIGLLASQASRFSSSFPDLALNFRVVLNQSISWLSKNIGISSSQIDLWIDSVKIEMIQFGKSIIAETLLNIGGLLVVLLLIPVYVFLILYYKPLLVTFIHEVFHSNESNAVTEILTATKKIIQSYLIGLIIEAIIVATLNSVGLLIIGIDYALLFGVIGAILNLIPYVGCMIAVALPMLIAFASNSPYSAFLVLALFTLVQMIDNNLIIPNIVASKVQLNALVSIIIVIAGGALWGISGMFLAIPLTAILKVIFDHIPYLKAWGTLLGKPIKIKK
jgi:predicted PurR-regulated permease PerM